MHTSRSSDEFQGPVASQWDRRALLQRGLFGGLGLSLFGGPWAIASAARAGTGGANFGPLLASDANVLQLPAGFSSRIVAESNRVVPGTSHVWHADPDGGATFATGDGGWVYVSNAERGSGPSGVGALRVYAAGAVARCAASSGTAHRRPLGPRVGAARGPGESPGRGVDASDRPCEPSVQAERWVCLESHPALGRHFPPPPLADPAAASPPGPGPGAPTRESPLGSSARLPWNEATPRLRLSPKRFRREGSASVRCPNPTARP